MTDNDHIQIEYGAVRNPHGGFLPDVRVNGRRVTDEWFPHGYSLDVALAQACDEATCESHRYNGDWDITIEPIGRFEVDARLNRKTIWPLFRTLDTHAEAMNLARRLEAQGFGWIRVRYADNYSAERFEPITAFEIGDPTWTPR